MPYRNIVISSAVHLSVKNEQLIISGEVSGSVPIEDIRVLLVESRQASVTTHALSRLAEQGVCTYFCDEKHLPCAVLLPFAQHSRQKKQIELQLNQSKPTVKRLWRDIVVAKIANQARCLSLCGYGKEEVEGLSLLTREVLSGDTTNVEGYAAAYYFKTLFGKCFTRDEENDINAALNYGYAIIRGYICRTLAVYGYEASFGIHHCSSLNNFNLADDLIEPFRPLVDLFVFQKCLGRPLSPELKRQLACLLQYEMTYRDEQHSVAYAIELTVQSLGRCFSGADGALVLPVLQGLKLHEYE